MPLTPESFIQKYTQAGVNERALVQSHFNDLCALLGVPDPLTADPNGHHYRFEQPVSKVAGGKGFADVWYAGHFGWEYKGKGADLRKAYGQLLAYREDLGNPPLLIVSDVRSIEVHSNFTGTQKVVETFTLDDLLSDAKRLRLRDAWINPGAYDPTRAREDATAAAVTDLLGVGDALKARGEAPERVAHFLVRCVFTLFAQDVGLLPRRPFSQLLDAATDHPEDFQELCRELFTLMGTGGKSLLGRIPYINGGVFSDPDAPALGLREIQTLQLAARRDWAHLEPSIFGTLFERVIDPGKRGQLGAHYTPLVDILDVVQPVVMAPLKEEWEHLRAGLDGVMEEAQRQRHAAHDGGLFGEQTTLWHAGVHSALSQVQAFQTRLTGVRVLDPAMGSGNFLFVTLRLLLDLEAEVRATRRELQALLGETGAVPPLVSPEQMLGLELNPYAHEIASMVLWIGYLQWLNEHGEPFTRSPVLAPLAGLEQRDAVLDEDRPAVWPHAEFIVGNPPFVGNTRMRQALGDTYAEAIRAAYKDRVPGFADLVAYWFEKSREQIEAGHTKRAGLIATNSIRGGANAEVLGRILHSGGIFLAWPDRAWVQDGAAVRVSIVGFDDGTQPHKTRQRHTGDEDDLKTRRTLSETVAVLHADLTSGPDLRLARRLKENAGRSFEGVKPAGKFDVPGADARAWLSLPNPSGVSNAEVLRPYISGDDVTDVNQDRWTVDFKQMPLEAAQQYRRPMQHVLEKVKPERDKNRDQGKRERRWQYDRARPEMRAALFGLQRFIVTTIHAKHRAFVWLSPELLPNNALTVIAADDDLTFGVLNSAIHVCWADAKGTALGVGNDSRYTSSTTFETFPFPRPTPAQQDTIEHAARFLVTAREYLHGQSVPGRASAVKIGLTNMYNLLTEYRSSGQEVVPGTSTLADAHDTLDAAVAAAYGWDWPLEEDELLTRLLALNLKRAGVEG